MFVCVRAAVMLVLVQDERLSVGGAHTEKAAASQSGQRSAGGGPHHTNNHLGVHDFSGGGRGVTYQVKGVVST